MFMNINLCVDMNRIEYTYSFVMILPNTYIVFTWPHFTHLFCI